MGPRAALQKAIKRARGGRTGEPSAPTQRPRPASERVGDDDRSAIIVPDPGADSPLDVRLVTMLAWVKPADPYNPPGDRGIIMNKENQYEFGVCNPSHSDSGNCGGVTTLQSAFGPCSNWRVAKIPKCVQFSELRS